MVPCKAFDAIDVYAGAARLSKAFRKGGFVTATLDIDHWPAWVEHKGGAARNCRNPLDLLTPAGFLLLDCLEHGGCYHGGCICFNLAALCTRTEAPAPVHPARPNEALHWRLWPRVQLICFNRGWFNWAYLLDSAGLCPFGLGPDWQHACSSDRSACDSCKSSESCMPSCAHNTCLAGPA